MLIVSLKKNDKVIIDDVEFIVAHVGTNKIKLAINADKNKKITVIKNN